MVHPLTRLITFIFRITLQGEQTIQVAPLWFEYGRALLMKEQENPTDDLLGAVAEEAKKQAKALGEELNSAENTGEEEEEEGEGQEEGGDEEDGQEGEEGGGEDASDMEVAWEALEVGVFLSDCLIPLRSLGRSTRANRIQITISSSRRSACLFLFSLTSPPFARSGVRVSWRYPSLQWQLPWRH
jgi:hypothetical protein